MIIDIALAKNAQPNHHQIDGTPSAANVPARPTAARTTNAVAANTTIRAAPNRSMSGRLNSSASAMPIPDAPKKSVNCEERS